MKILPSSFSKSKHTANSEYSLLFPQFSIEYYSLAEKEVVKDFRFYAAYFLIDLYASIVYSDVVYSMSACYECSVYFEGLFF